MEIVSIRAPSQREELAVPPSLSCCEIAALNINSRSNEIIEESNASINHQSEDMNISCNSSSSSKDIDEKSIARRNRKFSGKVVLVLGDGRCLFRSLVTAQSRKLQISSRNDYGRLECTDDAEEETYEADFLRASVVRLMFENLHFYSQLENGLINADQPVRVSFQKFIDRLLAMARHRTMPGELELNAAANVLEKQIFVLDKDLRVITVYGQDRFPKSVPIAVRFTKLRPDVGHYDAVVLDANNEVITRDANQNGNVYLSLFQRVDFPKMTLKELADTKYGLSARHPFTPSSSASCSDFKYHAVFRQPCMPITKKVQAGRKRWLIARKRRRPRRNLNKSNRRKRRGRCNKKIRRRKSDKVFWEYKISRRFRQVTPEFSVGESKCVLCKKKLISSFHSWMKCYSCGRVAHRGCVTKFLPCVATNGETDVYFLCQLCIRKKIFDPE